MSRQREILSEVVHAIQADHLDCSIILIGSVARREERRESDLDLNVFLPHDKEGSSWVAPENRWQLQVRTVIRDIRIDVAWETFDFLEAHLKGDGPFWILSTGEVLHDPSGRAAACLAAARLWA